MSRQLSLSLSLTLSFSPLPSFLLSFLYSQVALVAGFALGALSAALVVSSFAKARTSTTSGKAVTAPRPPTAGAATAKVSLISSSSSASASASLDKPSSGASLLDARLLREAVKSKDLAEAEAASAKREAAALHEEVAALEAKLAASQRTRRAVAAELAAAFGLPPTPTPASAPPRSGLGGGDSGGPSAASRFFASPAAAPGSEGRASRVAKALAAA